MDWMLDQILGWLARAALTALTGLFDLLRQSALRNPDVTTLPQVADVSGRSLQVVNVCFVLAILVAGSTVMARDTLQVRYGISELAPRLVLGFVAANMATPICRQTITIANALTDALTGEDLKSPEAFDQMRTHVAGAMSSPANGVLPAIMGLILAALAATLLVSWIVRIGVLIVLVGVAPVALACHALPYTDAAARLWWRSLLGCVCIPLLQAVVLFTAVRVFLTPRANFPALGLPGLGDPTSLMNLFVVMCLLWATVRIPSLVRRYVTQGGGGGGLGNYVVRVVVIQNAMRLVGAHRGGRALTRTARAVGGGA